MKRVLTAVILIPIVVIALFKAPLLLFALLVLGVAVLATHEYLELAKAQGFRPFRALSYLFLASLFGFVAWGSLEVARQMPSWLRDIPAVEGVTGLLLVAAPFLLMIASMRRDPLSQSLPDAAVSFLLLPYVGLSLVCLVLMRAYQNGALFVLFLMLVVWTGDTAAYYVGSAIGKHKLAPRVSPGKSWEGTIASAVGAAVVSVILLHFASAIYVGLSRIHLLDIPGSVLYGSNAQGGLLQPAPVWLALLFGLGVNVAAQLGDLAESALKRGAGVKDSGTLLPGHGGVLDRIDALLFAAPLGWLFYVSGLGVYFRLHGILGR
ncbi:MAG TPA: phosphatidate cytidylyltransferase [Terriglobales bacterium]